MSEASVASILTADSVTKLGPAHRGSVLVAGSHGGVYAGFVAAEAGVRAVILNDAGVGKEQAGIASLPYLDRIGMAAATVSHRSARIGFGSDMMRRGVISHANAAARAAGVTPGQACAVAARMLLKAPLAQKEPPPYAEARYQLWHEPGFAPVWGLDSASLVEADDAGHVLIIGSHGGAPGGKPEAALKHDAVAAVFNDAGIGIDSAGISRLIPLEKRRIPAATVDCNTARIGDARSSWDAGVISALNPTASALGGRIGMTCKAFVAKLYGSRGAKASA